MGETPGKQEVIDSFLNKLQLGRLATVENNQPHVVPVWYLWDGECIWISSYKSTAKIRQLRKNSRVAFEVDTEDDSSGVRGVLIKGSAELVELPFDAVREKTLQVYARYLGEQGILAPDPQEWANSPENLLIKIVPEKVNSW
jgi:PPOX class probable F420-dependent enzyme